MTKYGRYLRSFGRAARNSLFGAGSYYGSSYLQRKRKGTFSVRKTKSKRRRHGYTKTQRYRKRRAKVKQSIFDGKSYCHHPTLARKTYLNKMYRVIGTKQKYTKNQALRVTATVGTSAASYVTHWDPKTLNTLFNNQYVSTAAPTFGLYLQRMTSVITIQNADVNDAVVWLYSLVLRNDSNEFVDPVNDWKQGITDAGGGASPAVLYANMTPFQSKKFCERWKVHNVQKFTLSSGSVHVHTVSSTPYHKVNKERFTSTGTGGTAGADAGIRYLTSTTMIVAVGALVNDATNKNLIANGQVALDVTALWRYQTCGINDDVTLYKSEVTIPTIATANLIQEKTGAVVVDAVA